MQGGCQLVVGDFPGIRHPCQLQVQLFLLQFVARDVVFQDRALFPAGFHVGNDLLGQFQVLSQHPDLVVQPVKVQVTPCQHEANLLDVLLQVKFCQHLAKLRLPDAAADGPAGIDDLPGLQREVVAEVRHVHGHAVAEIPVPQPAVAQVAGRKGYVHIRKPLAPGSFQCFFGGCLSGPVRLDASALFVGKAEQFLYAHLPDLGIKALAV